MTNHHDDRAVAQRTRQTPRLALAATAVLVLGVVGLAACGGDQEDRAGPTDSNVPGPTTTLVAAEPSTTAGEPSGTGAPDVVYGSDGSELDAGAMQTLFDPTNGRVTGTAAIDFEESRVQQDGRYGQWNLTPELVEDASRPGVSVSRFVVGDLAYDVEMLPSEIALEDQKPAALQRFDRCGQSELVVTGASDSALPERIAQMSIGADGRYLVVLSAECPEEGTLLSGYTTVPYDLVLEVFDATAPGQPGRSLLTVDAADCQCSLAGFSGNGRFVALRSFDDGPLFRAFDLQLGSEVAFGEACDQSFTTFADTFGPWVGASSLAVVLDCDDRSELLILDVMPAGGALTAQLPVAGSLIAEVDVAHFDTPDTAWFTLCGFESGTCWSGHGDDPLIELVGVRVASFVPLGFRYGG